MSGDASTLPLRDAPPGGARFGRGRLRLLGREHTLGAIDRRVLAGALALAVIVAASALIVVMAANRPSILSATTHAGFFPRWMAGPLGGIWPGLTRNSTALKYLLTGAIAVMYVGYLVAYSFAPRLPARWVIAAIVCVHALFFLSPPLALTDVFNYVNYGRMEVVHHLNPYTTIPILEPHTDPSFALSNWRQLLSPYGPLFTLLTFAVVPLGVAASFWVLKGILALMSLGIMLLVWKCARLLGRDPLAAIVLTGLNPVVLVWGLGGDHNDFVMVFLIMLGFYLLLLARGRSAAIEPVPNSSRLPAPAPAAARGWLLSVVAPEIGAGAAFVTAVAVKASAAVLIPVVLGGILRSRRTLGNFVLGMLAAGIVVGAASLIAFGLHIPDLSTQSRLVTNESVPNLIGLALGSGGENQLLHTVMSAVLAAALLLCCWLAWRRLEPRSGSDPLPRTAGAGVERSIALSGWAGVALLLTLSWVLPWYVLWALPLAALSSSRRLRGAVLVLGVYLIVAWAPASGLLWKAIGFHPEKTPLGRLHQRYVKELLN
jgi:hypothetical protein